MSSTSGNGGGRRTSAPPSPTSPSSPHTYESFSDLVSTGPAPARRGLFSSHSSSGSTPRRWRTSLGGSDGDGLPNAASRGPGRYGSTHAAGRDGHQAVDGDDGDSDQARDGWELSTLGLICLTVGLAGAQLTWTVEMAFGTPYLLSLGLSKQATSLVWLAGPLSGLIVQPTIGAISDRSTSRYRRRFFIALSAALVVGSSLVVAYAHALASILASISGLGDWDPEAEELTKQRAIFLAVVGFYVLDFSLNGLQASLRALILDQSPRAQQVTANAWHGRMTHIANIFGYLAGYLNLGRWDAISWVGGGQFRKLAVLSCVVMTACVAVTCWTQEEKVGRPERTDGGGLLGVVNSIGSAIRNLPLSVRRVCYVQFFAWTAYFPFLFYSTTWVAEVLYLSLPPSSPPPSADTATRAGSLALLLFAIVSLLSGAFLPFLSTILLRPAVARRISTTTAKGKLVRRVLARCSPRNMWTFGLVLWAVGMTATFWVHTVKQAMTVVAILGVNWAISCWVPFALVMEAIRDTPASSNAISPPRGESPSPPDTPASKPSFSPQPFRAKSTGSRQPSMHRPVVPPLDPSASEITVGHGLNGTDVQQSKGDDGGTILGIHNLSIVAPQFFVAIVAALIFRILEASRASHHQPGTGTPGDGGIDGSNDVVWVLRFGGIAAIGGAVMSRWVLKTRSEREYQRVAMRFTGEERGLDAGYESGEEGPLLG